VKTLPTSMLKFLRAVQSCSAEMTDGERLVLWSLAIEADYRTGKNSHPGNSRLMRVTARKTPQGILYIVRGLIAKGLIEKTREGHPSFKGQSAKAAWYRIRLENGAFPDASDHESEESETMKAQAFTVEPTMKVNGGDHESEHHPTMKVNAPDHESPELSLSLLLSQKSLPPSLPEIRKPDGRMDSSKPSAMESQNQPERRAQTEEFFGNDFQVMGQCDKKRMAQIEKLASSGPGMGVRPFASPS